MLFPFSSKTSARLINISKVSYGKSSMFSKPFTFKLLTISSIIASSASVLSASSNSLSSEFFNDSVVSVLFSENSLSNKSNTLFACSFT